LITWLTPLTSRPRAATSDAYEDVDLVVLEAVELGDSVRLVHVAVDLAHGEA
jgi:hypothetical protein